jgi:UPF0271 protein
MEPLIINADLAEDEPHALTKALMGLIDAANICCGVHAGSAAKTALALALARDAGVQVGAHPGMAAGGGRAGGVPAPAEFAELLERQVGSFRALAARAGVAVGHVKLHGTLYRAVEADAALAQVLLEFLANKAGDLEVFALAGGRFAPIARAAGVAVLEEAFAERGYLAGGRLVPRGQPGAVIVDPAAVVGRLAQWRASGLMPAIGGTSFPLTAETLCVHADNPQALEILRALRAGEF